jgi:hypothetical protein
MYGPKETAVMIMQGKRPGGMAEEEVEMEFDGEEMEEEEFEYSDEQHSMAEELVAAVQDGDTHRILESIHGIYMSY